MEEFIVHPGHEHLEKMCIRDSLLPEEALGCGISPHSNSPLLSPDIQ